MTTLAELKAKLCAPDALDSNATMLSGGRLFRTDTSEVEYEFRCGLDFTLANACDSTWGAFNLRLLRHIEGLNLADGALNELLDAVQLDDGHWRWLLKSLLYQGDEYRWFFLVADGAPQAACLIFHPKASAFDGQGIFYIEYIAVAPWNRINPMEGRIFSGLGRLLIGLVNDYAVEHLRLRPGYSLHALPKAVAFYQAIGMQRFVELDKEGLPYFELPPEGRSAAGTLA